MRGPATILSGFRVPFFLLFAAASLATIFFVPQPFALAIAVLGGFIAALCRLCHPGLALAAALAPLPGILWFGTSAYAFSLAFAILMAAAYDDALLKTENPGPALWQPTLPLAGALLLAALWSLHAPVQLPGLLAASASVLIFLPLLSLAVLFGEDAIARGNRRREAFLRFGGFAAHVAEPRWGFSLCGVGVVLAVLGYFEIPIKPVLFDGAAILAVGLIVLVLTRDGRGALAALLASALLLLFTSGVSGALLLFLLFALMLGRATAAWRAAGESIHLAWTRAIEDQGVTILIAGLAAVIAAFPRGGVGAVFHATAGLIAAAILFPAFTVALYQLFPQRRSVEELYRSSAS